MRPVRGNDGSARRFRREVDARRGCDDDRLGSEAAAALCSVDGRLLRAPRSRRLRLSACATGARTERAERADADWRVHAGRVAGP